MRKRSGNSLIELAKQHPNRKSLKNADGSAYALILRRKLQDQAFAHMDTLWEPRSDEDILAVAKTCNTRSELQKKDLGAYKAILKRNLQDVAFAHMDTLWEPRSDEDILAVAKTCNTRNELIEKDRGASLAIYKRGLADRAFAHMKPKKAPQYTDTQLLKIAKQYETISDLQRDKNGAYAAIVKRNLKSQAFAHMVCGNTRFKQRRRAETLARYKGQTFNDLTVLDIAWSGGFATMKCRCKCGETHFVSMGNLTSGEVKSCNACSPKTTSRGEQELLAWVQEYAPDAVGDVSLGDSRLRWDVVVPSANLAIEYNGVVWHSTKFQSDTKYHLEKRLAAEKAGYRQIIVWEDEWAEKKGRMKALILGALGCAENRLIGARECQVSRVSPKEANAHHHANHVHQTLSRGDQHLTLCYKGEVIAVATFLKTELVRYSVKLGYRIPGGLARLLKAAGLTSCYTYCDRDHFTGEVYAQSGFSCAPVGQQMKYQVGDTRVERHKFMKNKLADMGIPVIGTEKESLAAAGIHQCWNSGTDKWEWFKNCA